MADFINFEAEVDTTDSEVNEHDFEEVKYLINNSLELDNDPLSYYKLDNISKNADDAIDEFLNEQNKSLDACELSNYCYKTSDDENLENFDKLMILNTKFMNLIKHF